MMEIEVGMMWGHEARDVGSIQSWKRRRNIFTPRTSGRNAALPTHFRLLTCRTVRH